MNGNNFSEKKYFLIMMALAVFALVKPSLAASNIQVEAPDPLFNVQNAAPREETSAKVSLKNSGPDAGNFPFKISITEVTKNLSGQLFFKILDPGGVCVLGCDSADPITVAELNDMTMQINNVPVTAPDAQSDYQFVILFNRDAGNDFQEAKVVFDATLGEAAPITETDDDGDDDDDDGGGGETGGVGAQNAALTSGLVSGAFSSVFGGETDAAGQNFSQNGTVEGDEKEPGKVEGVSVETCRSWPRWVWVLLLIAYFAVFLWRTFEKFKEQVEKRDIRWKWQAALAVAAFLFWYFFDFCREFQWFVIIALVGGAVIYLGYLYLFKKNIKDGNEKIENS